ncbi:bifunctional P-450/NADPH-P450 reductase [Acrasis kona]|uniref:Bifunctional P-450/NADPH-P450 reductase n=1 Tax=Acrasis kona TaxID=1008807 RepID=A0AAW2YWX5_9EUKA
MKYQSGDYLAILPVNPPSVVNKVLGRFNLQHDDTINVATSADKSDLMFPTDRPISVVELFTNYFELSLPANKVQVQTINQLCGTQLDFSNIDESDKRKPPSVIDILLQHPECNLPLAEFVNMSVPMRLRQYSISSSPLNQPDKCTITVGVLSAPNWNGTGVHLGVASNFLAAIEPGTLISVSIKQSRFKLPDDSKEPIIMIGAGTGLAPFRGFIQERSVRKSNGCELGPALLFFGCRDQDRDFIYKKELTKWSEEGCVELKPVFSRKPEVSGVKYVQDKLMECKEQVAALLKEDAYIYICGEGAHMAPQVKKILIGIYKESSGCTQEEAETRMSSIDKRYSVDVFA